METMIQTIQNNNEMLYNKYIAFVIQHPIRPKVLRNLLESCLHPIQRTTFCTGTINE